MLSKLSESQIEESFQLNNDGYKILNDGQFEKGLSMLEKSCALGLPNAIATLTWTKLLRNDTQGAIESYLKYRDSMENWYQSATSIFGEESINYKFSDQRLNVATNYATALYLSGESTDIVIETCSEANNKRWPEAMLLTYIARFGQANAEFTRNNIIELINTFKSVQEKFVDTLQTQTSPSALQKMTFLDYAKICQEKLEQLSIQELEAEMDSDFEHADGMLLGEMSAIIIDFARSEESRDNDDFFARNGLTIRICIALNAELIKVTEKGFDAIEQAWFDLCALFDADPYAIYDSLDDLMGIDSEE